MLNSITILDNGYKNALFTMLYFQRKNTVVVCYGGTNFNQIVPLTTRTSVYYIDRDELNSIFVSVLLATSFGIARYNGDLYRDVSDFSFC